MRNNDYLHNIERLRSKIDEIDHVIIRAINQRFDVVKEIGYLKKTHNQATITPEREKEIMDNIEKYISNSHYSAAIKNIYNKILEESRASQLNNL